jgi:threonine dehydrogenase-like Zn-dependent dehydrogenase
LKQAILYGACDLRIEDTSLDFQNLQPDQIYAETVVSALSTGTDLGNYLGDSTYVPGAPDYPRRIGYSNVAVVRRVGTDVSQAKVGQRVFSTQPHVSAYLARQSDILVTVPDGVSSEQASLSYLTHLGLAALRQANYLPGENVAIVGLGIIGLCTAALARAMGAKVTGIANSSSRADAAVRVGAHAAFLADDPELEVKLQGVFGDTGADIVVLTANSWDAFRLSVSIVRRNGRVSILGFPGRAQPQPNFNPLDPTWFYAKQLTLLGAGFAPRTDCAPAELRFNVRRNLEYILDLMASQAMRLDSLITHRLPVARMKEAYELASQHSKDMVGAVFQWG